MSTQDTRSHLHLVPRYSGRIPLEQIPWFEDVYTMSRLWRWLCFRELRPSDPAHFMQNGQEYAEEYERYLMWTGNGPKPGEAS